MDKSEKTREKIIETTAELINELGGETEKVTVRKIAERAQVSVGLVNHYFDTKEKLIETCVQRIIGGVIGSFRPGLPTEWLPKEKVKRTAAMVMDFLMENKEISRISILGDQREPKPRDNTAGTVMGFANGLSGGQPSREDLIGAFMLTAVMQTAFLRRELLKESMDIDFNDKTQRDDFLACVVDQINGRK